VIGCCVSSRDSRGCGRPVIGCCVSSHDIRRCGRPVIGCCVSSRDSGRCGRPVIGSCVNSRDTARCGRPVIGCCVSSRDIRRCGRPVIGCSLVVDVIVDMLQCLSECSGSQSETCDAELELWQESRLMVCLVSCLSHLLPFTASFVGFVSVRPGLT